MNRADQPDIRKPLGSAPLATEWRGDLLGGVMTIKGRWADGTPMLAIPNYARNNRNTIAAADEAATGNAAIDYSGGATVGASTNAAAKPQRARTRTGNTSAVWLKDQTSN